ncbi:MAG: M1 family peptidase [Crocinitomicaceae bacterium]|nr:M1 family peptidase [Crocinitomicaceae bacterium]
MPIFRFAFILYCFTFLLVSCTATKPTDSPIQISSNYQDTTTNVPESIEETPYKSSRTLFNDLIHTKLEIKLDWENTRLYGQATLTLKPHFYTTDSLYLDAQGMEIKSIISKGKQLTYAYSKDVIAIKLDKSYTRKEQYTLTIDYIAKPEERKTEGGDAIMSNKGLYFINPKGEDKSVMPQVWTQGETQANSVWFPTIDAPNVKSSQEIIITVQDKYVTLSNGKLISSLKNMDGTRTDHWKQELPHAPYLFMLAVGEYKVVKDSYTRPNGTKMDVHYYVEPEWENQAKAIFGETPKMIAFFSKLTGIEFPWDKYHQIVVRDYVSGAMENTGAVIFGDFVYKTQRELLDNNDESIVAHELFHHWFGDLVTCESWANLPLNESFANYAQYLWDEHRHGKEQADYGNEVELNEFFSALENGENHDLVWYNYPKNDDMFDKHSYNKGGRVLHMLRAYLGDEAFFEGLKLYLQTNQFKAAELDHLRLAFEEVSGQDLHWFFNQWFLNAGIPNLKLEYYYSAANKELVLTVTQQQDFQTTPLYRLPLEVAVYDEMGEHIHKIEIDEIENKFVFPVAGKLKTMVFDIQQVLLSYITDEKPAKQFVAQYYLNKRYTSRKDAVLYGTAEDTPESQQLILDALKDPFWKIREVAIEKAVFLTDLNKYKGQELIREIVKLDSNSAVRVAALRYLNEELAKEILEPILKERIVNDQSYEVIGVALEILNANNPAAAITSIKPLEQNNSPKIKLMLAKIYAADEKEQHTEYFIKLFQENSLKGYDALSLLNTFTIYMSKQPINTQLKALEIYKLQKEKGNYYAKMYLPQNVKYLIQSIEANNTSQDKSTKSKSDSYLEELKEFYETLEIKE